MWHVMLFQTFLLGALPLGGAGFTWASEKLEFRNWLDQFRKKTAYPLYCIIISHQSDTNISNIINDEYYRTDVAKISGKDCCFIYFRSSAEEEKVNLHVMHTERTYDVVDWLELEIDKMPCLLFFERLDYNKYIYIDLSQMTSEKIIVEMGKIFAFIRKNNRISPFEAIKKYDRLKVTTIYTKKTLSVLFNTICDIAIEYIKKVPNG